AVLDAIDARVSGGFKFSSCAATKGDVGEWLLQLKNLRLAPNPLGWTICIHKRIIQHTIISCSFREPRNYGVDKNEDRSGWRDGFSGNRIGSRQMALFPFHQRRIFQIRLPGV